jgi:hypothetical protein
MLEALLAAAYAGLGHRWFMFLLLTLALPPFIAGLLLLTAGQRSPAQP